MNTQLRTLLARAPFSIEDCYNISVIFHALSEQRQQLILDNWAIYAGRLLAEKEKLDSQKEKECILLLSQINTLFDETKAKEAEKSQKTLEKKQQIREELESTTAYNQLKNMRIIRKIIKNASK